MYDLIIIGGGPAGLTAAVYAVRKRIDFLLVSLDLGGKTNSHMTVVEGQDSYQVINGAQVVRGFRNEIEYLDFARVLEKAIRFERIADHFCVTTESGRQFQSRAAILATGAQPTPLGVPGADQYFLRGLSYSTVSYAPLYLDKTVALVGAGDMAFRGAAELAQTASQVYVVAPQRDQLDSPLARRLLASDRVTLLDGYQPVAVEGDTYARRLIVKGPDGDLRSLDVAVIFVELGLRPLSDLVEGWVVLDEQKRVMVNCKCETSVPGLYAAGDVTSLPAEQVLIAIGEGAKAALSAYEYLLGVA